MCQQFAVKVLVNEVGIILDLVHVAVKEYTAGTGIAHGAILEQLHQHIGAFRNIAILEYAGYRGESLLTHCCPLLLYSCSITNLVMRMQVHICRAALLVRHHTAATFVPSL